MLVTKTSVLSGVVRSMEIPISSEDLTTWQSQGGLVQHAFPQLSKEQREFMLTGIVPEEWDSIFGEDCADFDDE